MTDRVTLKIEDQIAFVTLNRPEKYNALDVKMFDALIDTAKKLSRDKQVRAVILSGEGPGFCGGLDIGGIQKNPLLIAKLLVKPGRRYTNLVQEAAMCWRKLPVPVIAAIHGKCLGGGLQIVCGADFRIARPDAEMSILEIKWGLIPDMSGSVTFRELIPIDVAKELAMTGRIFDAVEAKELGLVSKLAEDPVAEAVALAERIKTRSPDAVAGIKRLFNDTWVADEREALNLETRLQKKILGRWNQLAAVSQQLSDSPKAYGKRKIK